MSLRLWIFPPTLAGVMAFHRQRTTAHAATEKGKPSRHANEGAFLFSPTTNPGLFSISLVVRAGCLLHDPRNRLPNFAV
jgi:hypothetical protein